MVVRQRVANEDRQTSTQTERGRLTRAGRTASQLVGSRRRAGGRRESREDDGGSGARSNKGQGWMCF